MKEIGIGLLGLGTVGAGVAQAFSAGAQRIAESMGVRPVLRRIAELSEERRRLAPPGVPVSSDSRAVVEAADVDVVVELIGGTNAARELVTKALELGKPVVTANKALLAEHGGELFALAARNKADIYFEASVAGGIPVIRALHEGLVADRIRRMVGILNGTCNYILTSMEQTGHSFASALKSAQKAGYAESDPALDIDGWDTAHKAIVLTALVYGQYVPLKQITVEGIRHLNAVDMEYARELGYCVRLLAVIRELGDEIEVRVHPALVPSRHILASVKGVFNALLVDSENAGELLFYGRGAGQLPTTSAVLSNIADAALNLAGKGPRRPTMPLKSRIRRLRDSGAAETRYYIRLTLLDRPGVFGEIGTLLGRHGISIASVLQKEDRAGEQVPVVIITHAANEKAFAAALAEINALPFVGAPAARLRIVNEI